MQCFTSPEKIQNPDENYEKKEDENSERNKIYLKHKEEYKVKPDLAMKLIQDTQVQDLLLEFDCKAQNFVNKCEEFLNFSNNSYDVNLINNDNPSINNVQEGLNRLINYLFEHVKLKGTLFNDKKFNESLHKRNNFIIIDSIVEGYLTKENEFIESLKEKNTGKNKKESLRKLNNIEQIKEKESLIKKIWSPEGLFNISEAVFILVLIYISFAYFNTYPFTIKDMSIFNEKVTQTFDERLLCNNWFLRMTATSDINYWFNQCYIQT